MFVPAPGDVLLRDFASTSLAGFVIVDVMTHQVIGGPFATLRDAARAARAVTTGTLWWENTDERGRSMGPPFTLPQWS